CARSDYYAMDYW
nr:immunoglobulin heavy chain junction region [Mus musculus]MBK4185680.1 immunoglobulin heavy chain junction region [Mus musculus]